jgi:hypothetical protein
MPWNSGLRAEFLKALLSSYDLDGFGRMLQLRATRNVEDYVDRTAERPDQFLQVIMKAERGGWIDALVRAAREEQPGNADMQSFFERYEAAPVNVPQTGPPTQSREEGRFVSQTPTVMIRIRHWDQVQFNGLTLELLAPLDDIASIPTARRNQVLVADVRGVLHFRIFDNDGRKVVDTNENELPDKGPQLAQLRPLLSGLWGQSPTASTDRDRIVGAVTSIVDHIHFDLRAWLYPPGAVSPEKTLVNVNKQTKAQIPKILQFVRRETAKWLNRHSPGTALDQVDLEFVLPSSHIALAVDCWKYEDEDIAQIRLGSRHRVYVRRAESADPILYNRLLTRWSKVSSIERISDNLSEIKSDGAVFVLTLPDVDDVTYQDLLEASGVSCVLLCCCFDFQVGSRPPTALNAVLKAGIPVALWIRKRLCDDTTLRGKLELLCSRQPAALPEQVRRERFSAKGDNSHVGSHITLLYENPNRPIPPETRLAAPTGRGR